MLIEDTEGFRSREEEEAAAEFNVLEQKSDQVVHAHKSWKEKFVDWGKRYGDEHAHIPSLVMAESGLILSAMAEKNFHDFMREGMGFTGHESPPEHFLIVGGAFLGTAALLEISRYVAVKLGEKKKNSNELNAQET